jgi:hypothetical protein
LIVCGLYLPHSTPDEFCQRHINSVEQISAESSLNDLILVCGDFNLTGVTWVCREDALCPSSVTSARDSIIVDGMADCDMGQVNSIPNQYGVYLDLIFFNNPFMVRGRNAPVEIGPEPTSIRFKVRYWIFEVRVNV